MLLLEHTKNERRLRPDACSSTLPLQESHDRRPLRQASCRGWLIETFGLTTPCCVCSILLVERHINNEKMCTSA